MAKTTQLRSASPSNRTRVRLREKPKRARPPLASPLESEGPSRQDREASSGWSFLTNHAHILFCIAEDSGSRLREIAERVGVTERAVQRIVADLAREGYVIPERQGRRNHYRIVMRQPLRHSIEKHRCVSDLLDLVRPLRPPRED